MCCTLQQTSIRRPWNIHSASAGFLLTSASNVHWMLSKDRRNSLNFVLLADVIRTFEVDVHLYQVDLQPTSNGCPVVHWVFGIILVRIFLQSDWILSLYIWSKCGKIQSIITPIRTLFMKWVWMANSLFTRTSLKVQYLYYQKVTLMAMLIKSNHRSKR